MAAARTGERSDGVLGLGRSAKRPGARANSGSREPATHPAGSSQIHSGAPRWRLGRLSTRGARGSRGQSYTEYLVVVGVLVLALVAGSADGESPVARLISATKAQYNAYAFALSMPDLPDCENNDHSLIENITTCLKEEKKNDK